MIVKNMTYLGNRDETYPHKYVLQLLYQISDMFWPIYNDIIYYENPFKSKIEGKI